MILAFVPAPLLTDTRTRIDRITDDALQTLGALTREANRAATVSEALLIHERANRLRRAVLELEDIAIR